MTGAEQDSTCPDLSGAELFLAGMTAGSVAKGLTAPVDRVRILYQINPQRKFTFRKAVKTSQKIWKNTGLRGLWRGNMAATARIAPYAGIQFYTFEKYSKLMQDEHYAVATNPVIRRFYAGAGAGMSATIATYPFDLLRTRMAAHWSPEPKYDSMRSGFGDILRAHGVMGLYRGIFPTLFALVPYSGTSFMIFETLKAEWCTSYSTEEADIPFWFRLAAGGIAGVTGQFVAYPLHVARRRMQVVESGSFLEIAAKIYRQEGIRSGLFKGVSLTFIKGPPQVAIAFVVNDLSKKYFRKRSDIMNVFPVEQPYQAQHAAMPPPVEPSSPLKTVTPIQSLLCGSLAGAVAKTIIAPGDRIKILFQTNEQRTFTWRSAMKMASRVWRYDGITGFWRGHGATLMRVAPSAGITYTMFPIYERFLIDKELIEKGVHSRFVAGACAGMTATSITYPLDLMRARMAAHWGAQPLHTSYFKAFATVVEKEGVFSLFSGLRPTLIGNAPYVGLSFTCFETLKAQYQTMYDTKDIPVLVRFGFASSSGLVAQSMTYPLDIVRRRMQTQPTKYKNEIDALRTIYLTEGLKKGLFKGLSMNYVKGPIAVGTSFTINDKLKQLVLQRSSE